MSLTKFYWIRDKRTGDLSIASMDDRYDPAMWAVLNDEQHWDRQNVEAQFDILDEIVPPSS